MASFTIADPATIPGGSDPFVQGLLLYGGQAIWPVIFGLFAILAVILPDGHLPAGRWRTVGLVAIAVAVICATASVAVPTLSDILILPMFVVLALAAASLIARRTRARGIERQQLRWIVASIVLLFAAFVVALVVAFAVPGADASGLAWLPVAAAFPIVPIAIGIAVLRYRLYEIDTVINRALVYGLLTAVLAAVRRP